MRFRRWALIGSVNCWRITSAGPSRSLTPSRAFGLHRSGADDKDCWAGRRACPMFLARRPGIHMPLKCEEYSHVCVMSLDGDCAGEQIAPTRKAFEERIDQHQ